MRLSRSSDILRAGIFALVLCFFVSCGDDSDPASPNDENENIPTDLTEPSAVIDAHSKALKQRNHDAYAALLGPQFEFVPRASDQHILPPWLLGGTWGLTDELTMVQHMFDPNFGHDDVHPVQSIHFQPTILNIRPLSAGRFELTCSCQGRALTGEDDGWFFDTMLLFKLGTIDGYLRILQIEELEMLRPGGTREVESASWGIIKWRYQ